MKYILLLPLLFCLGCEDMQRNHDALVQIQLNQMQQRKDNDALQQATKDRCEFLGGVAIWIPAYRSLLPAIERCDFPPKK